MKNRLHLGIFVLAILSFTSCTKYVQLIHLRPTAEDVFIGEDSGIIIVENDTISIRIGFWSNGGLLKTEFENKLNKPIYIDWKKSSLIVDNYKLNFWEEKEETYETEYYKNFLISNRPSKDLIFNYSAGAGITAASTFKPERITFLPPRSKFPKNSFRLANPEDYYKLEGYQTTRIGNKKVYFTEYTPVTTIGTLRLFLTYSLSEDIVDENYIDIEFYVHKIENIPLKIITKNFSSFQSENKFYFILQEAIKGSSDPNPTKRIEDPVYL